MTATTTTPRPIGETLTGNAAVYAAVTDRMLAALRRGVAPWRTPWAINMPTSLTTGNAYRGVNTLLLWCAASDAGYNDHRWITFRQAKKLGGYVRKGEHGTSVVLWKPAKRRTTDEQGNAEEHRYLLARTFTVFNAEQCDGLAVAPLDAAAGSERIDDADAAVAAYVANGGPRLIRHDAPAAFYVPALDRVCVPKSEHFRSTGDHYSTLFHELSHSTGHRDRLDRDGIAQHDSRFGEPTYAREELVAEMGAAFLCARFGIDPSEHFDNSASYLAGWTRRLEDSDARLITSAASAAHKAADLILSASETQNVDHAAAA